jgi:hypothetical protein
MSEAIRLAPPWRAVPDMVSHALTLLWRKLQGLFGEVGRPAHAHAQASAKGPLAPGAEDAAMIEALFTSDIAGIS